MIKRAKYMAAVMAFAVVFVMLWSSFYIAAESDHECTGENCPICEQISVCYNTIRTISSGIAAAVAAVLLSCTFSRTVLLYNEETPRCTPVSLKVKLLN